MASIAELWVSVLPETSRISDGIVRAFRDVDPKATEAGRRWGREIESGLSGVTVELKADTTKARGEINEAVKDRKTSIEVDADTAKAQAQIDAIARDRKATIEVNADTMMASVQRVGSQMGESLVTSGSSAAPRVASSLAGSMGTVGTALTAELVAGAVAAAASVAAALSGVIGLIPAGVAGAAGVLGTLVTGLDGVKDAWDAANKAADSSGKDQEAKAKATVSAQRSLRDAVLDEANAQKDVANARRDARQQLEDLNIQLRGGVIDEKQALLDAQAARRDLTTGRFRDAIEYQQAQLRVEQADQRVLESHERNVQLQGKAAEANARGVDQSDLVVAANQRLARAHEQVAAAQAAAAEAAKPSSNADALAQAMGKLSPNAQQFINTLQGLKPAWEALKFSVQDAFFAGLGPELQRLATQYLPVLKDAMSGLAGTMNTAFKDIGAWLSKPETMAAIKDIIANIGSSFQIWSQSLVPFSQAFLTITQVGSGFLPQLAQMITDGANAFNNFIQSAAKSGDLHQWMQVGLNALVELAKLLPVVGKMFLDLAPAGIPTLQTIGMLLRAIEPVFEWFGKAMATYQTGVNAFWGAVGRLNDKLGALEQTSHRVFDNVTKVIEAAWRIAKPIFDAFGGAIKGLGLDTLVKTLGGLLPGGLPNAPTTPPTPAGGSGGGVPAAGGGAATGGTGWAPKLSDLRSGRARLASGFNWDAVLPHEGGTWDNADTGHNGHFGGLQFSPETWADYGGLEIAPRADLASPEQQKMVADRVAFYGWNGKPPQGLQVWEAITKGRVPGITTSSRPPNATPTPAAPAPALPVPVSPTPALPVPAMPSLPGVAVPYYGLPPGSNSGGYGGSGAQFPDWVNQIAAAFGIKPSTYPGHQESDRNEPGFAPNPQHQNRAIDWSGPTENLQRFAEYLLSVQQGMEQVIWQNPQTGQQIGIAGGKVAPAGYYAGDFDGHKDHVHTRQSMPIPMPGSGGGLSMPGYYPSAMMPTIASPGGISPDGTMPLGTQNSPMYVQPAGKSGAEQLGQDLLSGILEIFGLDGLIGNPLGTPLFAGFKGIMSMLTGKGGGAGAGLPASAWQAMGGDGAALPQLSGVGGDLLGGLASSVLGNVPQPYGQLGFGGPAQPPDEFAPVASGVPGLSGGQVPGKTAGPAGNQVDNRIIFNGPVGNPQAANQAAMDLNMPRARQAVKGLP